MYSGERDKRRPVMQNAGGDDCCRGRGYDFPLLALVLSCATFKRWKACLQRKPLARSPLPAKPMARTIPLHDDLQSLPTEVSTGPLHHRRQRGEEYPLHTTMASKSVTRPIGSLLRVAKGSNVSRNAVRSFATTLARPKELAGDVSDLPNMRHAQRGTQGAIHAPVVNPADRAQEKANDLHKYGQYLLSCMPKYIQQYAPQHPNILQ